MVLVHDDDLTRLDGIYGNTVSRGSLQLLKLIFLLDFLTFFSPPTLSTQLYFQTASEASTQGSTRLALVSPQPHNFLSLTEKSHTGKTYLPLPTVPTLR